MYKSFLFVENSNVFFKNFFSKITGVLVNFLNKNFNFYIFSKLNFLNYFWKVDLKSFLKKSKKKVKFLRLLRYFFFKNNIKLTFFVNFDKLNLILLLKKTNVIKVGFLKNCNFSKHNYFNYFIKIFGLDYIKEFYINYYIYGVYLNFLTKKFLELFISFCSSSSKKHLTIIKK